ncbi:MAG: hypothetical protein D3908_10340 [Candidatus Electrothrix sp. AUS4]|nr:hypothetical protein [Candidatus Electrothrix sp. AUS4]
MNKQYETIFINGKQKRVRRPPSIDGMSVDEFIARNADPIWLHQNGYHELLAEWEDEQGQDVPTQTTENPSQEDSELPF